MTYTAKEVRELANSVNNKGLGMAHGKMSSCVLALRAFADLLEAREGGEDALDAARLDWIEHEANTVRAVESGDVHDVYFEVVSHHMSAPAERVIGQGRSVRNAIDAAMAEGGEG